ncbi:MAG: efflux RND transporter periplasmic adaptor subunit [Anaerolineae bacterium]|nr:efflux RND transporter periplasmic adaptor subunit [Anaerolineae bacterium]
MQYHKSLLVVIGLLVLALAGCSGATTPAATDVPVAAIPQSIKATGIVVPEKWAKVSFSTSGKLVALPVEVGDQVRPGGTLARLEDIDLAQTVKVAEIQVEEARINIDIAQQELDKVVSWAPNKNSVAAAEAALANADASLDVAQAAYDQVAWLPSISAAPQSLQLEQATNNFNVAKSNLDYLYSARPDARRAADNLNLATLALQRAELNKEIAEEALKKSSLKAPFGGTVNELYVREGEVVSPGTPVMLIADLSTLRIETTDLNENDVVNVKVGDKVKVTFEALPDLEIEGTVTEIALKSTEGIGVNYTIVIELDELPEAIRWGMTAYIDIPLDQEKE